MRSVDNICIAITEHVNGNLMGVDEDEGCNGETTAICEGEETATPVSGRGAKGGNGKWTGRVEDEGTETGSGHFHRTESLKLPG